MTTDTIPIPKTADQDFQTNNVLPIVGAHFVHDTYTAAVPALLPVLIEKLSLSLTLVGTLTAILQLPAILNPFIGYLADRVSLRYFVILAPGITATFIGSLGFATSYVELAVMLFAAGISVACFHAPAPAMVGRLAGNQVGKGMSLFMAAGELGRTLGPIMAVWAVSLWTLDGYYRVIFIGWGATLVLYSRLRHVPARAEPPGSMRSILPVLRSLFVPLILFILFRSFLRDSLAIFLPIYISGQGGSLWLAGAALSILEGAGVLGALSSGTISDYLGRKKILLIATATSVIFMLLFLNVDGWMLIPVLVLLGFTTLSSGPILLAMVQDQMPRNRAVGNGLYLMVAFLMRPIALVIIGYLGDIYGLEQVFLWSALVSLLSIPFIFWLPDREKEARAG